MTPQPHYPENGNGGFRWRLRVPFFRCLAGFGVVVFFLVGPIESFPPGVLAQDTDRALIPEATPVKIQEEAPDTDTEAGDAALAEAESEVKNAVTPQMSRLFPIGRPFKGVRIPSYTGDSLTSVVEAEVMRRLDEERLHMEELVITSFAEGEEADTRIFMDRAIYNMITEKLESETPTRIVQPRFEMVGDRMTFDNRTQVGHMVGNVKMRIFGVDQVFGGGILGGAGEETEPEAAPRSDSE